MCDQADKFGFHVGTCLDRNVLARLAVACMSEGMSSEVQLCSAELQRSCTGEVQDRLVCVQSRAVKKREKEKHNKELVSIYCVVISRHGCMS